MLSHRVTTGVTGFYPTVPSVSTKTFKSVLSFLGPQETSGAAVLGCHVEGPFLAPSKKGAHDESKLCSLSEISPVEAYGDENIANNIRIVTIGDCIPTSTPLFAPLS
jgi:N-acetylglucosamine-6-phosphate deacetylase